MMAILIPAPAGITPDWLVFVLVVPILLLLLRIEPSKASRRLIAIAALAAVFACIAAADELVILHPCVTCSQIDTSTWSGYLLWLMNCWGLSC